MASERGLWPSRRHRDTYVVHTHGYSPTPTHAHKQTKYKTPSHSATHRSAELLGPRALSCPAVPAALAISPQLKALPPPWLYLPNAQATRKWTLMLPSQPLRPSPQSNSSKTSGTEKGKLQAQQAGQLGAGSRRHSQLSPQLGCFLHHL